MTPQSTVKRAPGRHTPGSRRAPRSAWAGLVLSFTLAAPVSHRPPPADRPGASWPVPAPITHSIGEREIVDEEPADGSPPVGADLASELPAPDGPAIRSPAGSRPPVELGAPPRFVGTVTRDGKRRAVFQVDGRESPWVGRPGDRIGDTHYRLEDLDGTTSRLGP